MLEREDSLLARAAAGDRRALARIYELHVDGLHAFVYFKVGCNAALAEDAVQDTFLKALAEAASFDPARGPLRAWLLETSRNVVRRYLNRQQGIASLDVEEVERLARGLEGEAAPMADDLLVQREVQTLVVATIERLPARYRALLELKYVAGASLEELAVQLANENARNQDRDCARALAGRPGAGPSGPRGAAGARGGDRSEECLRQARDPAARAGRKQAAPPPEGSRHGRVRCGRDHEGRAVREPAAVAASARAELEPGQRDPRRAPGSGPTRPARGRRRRRQAASIGGGADTRFGAAEQLWTEHVAGQGAARAGRAQGGGGLLCVVREVLALGPRTRRPHPVGTSGSAR